MLGHYQQAVAKLKLGLLSKYHTLIFECTGAIYG